jgi:hypothetical protein
MKVASSRLWLLLVLIMPLVSLAQGGKSLTQFKLPASNRTGLIDIFIEYEPVFRVDQIGNEASVILNMNVRLSRANDVKGSFWYRYWYEGEQYTDQQVGKDVFAPIDLDYLGLVVTIMGPDALIKTVTWTKAMQDQIVVRMPGKHKASEFSVFIKGLESVSFRGDEAIKRAILNLKATAKKKAEDDQKREADKLLADRKAAEEKAKADKVAADKQKADREGADKASRENPKVPGFTPATNHTTAARNTETSDDDFWGNKKTPPAGTVQNMPDLVMSTDGKYYRRGADGKPKEISYDEYQALKREKAALQQKANTPVVDAQAKREADQKALDATMAKIKKDQADDAAMWKDIDHKLDLNRQAFQASDAREAAKENVKEVTRMTGNYGSVDQLMSDFNNRMAQLNSAMNDLTEKRNAAVNASVDANFNGAGEAEYGEAVKAIGGFVNMMKADKEKKQAQADLRAQKEAMLRHMEAEEKRMLTEMRTDLFKRFKEGSLPLSSSKVEANTIYYFIYSYDPAQISTPNPTLYVSNIFPVDRYSDGTWPFKTAITNQVAKLTPYAEVLHGYYTNPNEAVAMRNALQNVFTQSGGRILTVSYKGKKSSGATSGSTDFWETGKQAPGSTSKEAKPVKKDDFWNN